MNDGERTTRKRFEETFMNKVREEAKRIDPQTAQMTWRYVEVCDPYNLGLDLPDEMLHCIGREYFLIDRNGDRAIRVSDVRDAHPDIPDGEWKKLMQAARRRDDEPDPFPMFHAYREQLREASATATETPDPETTEEETR